MLVPYSNEKKMVIPKITDSNLIYKSCKFITYFMKIFNYDKLYNGLYGTGL